MTPTAPCTSAKLTLLRLVVYALLFAWLATLLAACGGSGDEAPPPTQPSLTQPTDQSSAAGASSTFGVAVQDGTGASFQWQQLIGTNWTPIVGATNALLVISAATLAQTGTQYRVLVTVSGGVLTSNAVTLTVTPAPVAPAFTAQPTDVTVTAPASAGFVVAVSGTPTAMLQWQLSSDGGTTWNNVSSGGGATGTTYTTPATTTAMNGFRFRALASNGVGSAISSTIARLSVDPAAVAPSITTQPSNQSLTEPARATFSVAATGTAPLTYQWQRFTSGAWSNIAGASNAVYTSAATARATDNGAQLRVVVSNALTSVVSDTATLTVLAAASKTWGVAEVIETASGNVTSNVELAMNASGHALAVWGQDLSGFGRVDISSNSFTASSAWGSAQLVETNDAQNAPGQPQIVIDAAGNGFAVWTHSGVTGSAVWANRYSASTGWGVPQMIGSVSPGVMPYPNVACDSSGNALAVWGQYDGTRTNVWANRYTVGGGWGTAELIETDHAGDAARGVPAIAFDGNGNALAAWEQSAGTRTDIWSNRYTAGSGWGTAQLVETDNAGPASGPNLAFDSNGNALVVWHQSDGTRTNIWANRYTAGSGWGTAELIETDNVGPGGANDAQIAFDVNGNAMAMWTARDAANRNTIQFNRYTPSGGWGLAAVLVSASVGSRHSGARFAFDSSGAALAVWTSSDGTNSLIASGRYTAASGWVFTPTLGGGSSRQASTPRIAIDGSGNAVAVWVQNAVTAGSSGPNSVWAARYR